MAHGYTVTVCRAVIAMDYDYTLNAPLVPNVMAHKLSLNV